MKHLAPATLSAPRSSYTQASSQTTDQGAFAATLLAAGEALAKELPDQHGGQTTQQPATEGLSQEGSATDQLAVPLVVPQLLGQEFVGTGTSGAAAGLDQSETADGVLAQSVPPTRGAGNPLGHTAGQLAQPNGSVHAAVSTDAAGMPGVALNNAGQTGNAGPLGNTAQMGETGQIGTTSQLLGHQNAATEQLVGHIRSQGPEISQLGSQAMPDRGAQGTEAFNAQTANPQTGLLRPGAVQLGGLPLETAKTDLAQGVGNVAAVAPGQVQGSAELAAPLNLDPTANISAVRHVNQPAHVNQFAPPPLLEQVRGPLGQLRSAPQGEHVFSIRITPQNLGPVQVRAHIGTDGIRVELVGATDLVRDQLRTMLGDLRKDLQSTGMSAQLSVADQDAASHDRMGDSGHNTRPNLGNQGADKRGGSATTAIETQPIIGTPEPLNHAASGVDILA